MAINFLFSDFNKLLKLILVYFKLKWPKNKQTIMIFTYQLINDRGEHLLNLK